MNCFTKDGLNYSDSEIRGFVKEMECSGICEISDFFTQSIIEDAIHQINSIKKSLGVDAFSLRYSDMDPCMFTRLKESPALKVFLSRILEASGVVLNGDIHHDIHHVIRYTNGKYNNRDAHLYHFDAYNLTLLMPLLTPIEPKLSCGDLIVFPNIRKFSANLFKNIFFKVAFQNRLVRAFASKDWFRKMFNCTTVMVKPGNIYIFYGFRTYHGNIELEDNLIRATALFHYHNPLYDSKIISYIERNRKKPQDK